MEHLRRHHRTGGDPLKMGFVEGSHYANIDGTDFGVNVDPGTGDMFGLAWGENVGWINFDTRASLTPYGQQARYDAVAMRFRGYAWGENIGWINLDDSVHYVAVLSPCSGLAWRSVRTHTGSLGGTVDLAIDLDPSASDGAVKTEPRNGGIQWIEVDFTEAVQVVGPLEARDANVGTVYAVTSSSLSPDGMTLVMEWNPGLPDEVCYVIDLAGAVECDLSNLGIGPDADCMVRGLVGDLNGDSATNNTDKSWVASLNGHPLLPDNIRFDVNLDGSINNTDKSLVASRNGRGATCP